MFCLFFGFWTGRKAPASPEKVTNGFAAVFRCLTRKGTGGLAVPLMKKGLYRFAPLGARGTTGSGLNPRAGHRCIEDKDMAARGITSRFDLLEKIGDGQFDPQGLADGFDDGLAKLGTFDLHGIVREIESPQTRLAKEVAWNEHQGAIDG